MDVAAADVQAMFNEVPPALLNILDANADLGKLTKFAPADFLKDISLERVASQVHKKYR